MKTFCTNTDNARCVYSVLVATIELFNEPFEQVTTLEAADLIFVINDRAKLNEVYTPEKVFAFFTTNKNSKENLPENVILLGMTLVENIEVIKKAFEMVAVIKSKQTQQVVPEKTIEAPDDLVETEGAYNVLVIDDNPENLELAKVLLGSKHQVIVALGFAEGMKALNAGGFDAVLSDMNMPDNRYYSSFNMEVAKIGGTNPYGFFVIFEATAKGIPVAIVTDGNHHMDWVSAGLDHIKETEVNSRTVLMFNNIGKRWDTALLALEVHNALEPRSRPR